MKFGIIKDRTKWKREGKSKFTYVSNLSDGDYYDITSIANLNRMARKVGLSKQVVEAAMQSLMTDRGGYDNLQETEKKIVVDRDIEVTSNTGTNKILFNKDKEYIIYQEGALDFDFDSSDFGESGVTITIRLYCNGAPVKINGYGIEEINSQYKTGKSKFVVLQNDGVFQVGFINFLTFKYTKVDSTDEIRVSIQAIREVALGSSTGVTDWSSSTYYNIGDDIIYNLVLYNCIEAHTSTTEFEREKWEQEGGISAEDVTSFEEGLDSLDFTNPGISL